MAAWNILSLFVRSAQEVESACSGSLSDEEACQCEIGFGGNTGQVMATEPGTNEWSVKL